MNSIEITLFGGTGLIGGYLKDLIIDDPFFNKINFVTRRVYKSNQKKLVNHVIDFSKYKEISNAIKNSEIVYSAIGTTQSKVNWNKDEYRKIDYDININIEEGDFIYLIGETVYMSNFFMFCNLFYFFYNVK